MLQRYFYILYFFTTWNVILVLFHKYTHKIINLLFTSFVVLIISMYISYINPKYYLFKFDNKEYVFKGNNKLFLIDLPMHIGVFVFIYLIYYKYYKKNNLTIPITICFLLFYFVFFNTPKIYNISRPELLAVASAGAVLYFFI